MIEYIHRYIINVARFLTNDDDGRLATRIEMKRNVITMVDPSCCAV
jgi:hypothetical protein